MSNIDYAALGAEEQETDDYAQEELVHEDAPAPVTPAAPASSPRRRSKKQPLSEEERLARALAQVETLQAKVLAKREERRSRLVEDLYRKHNVVEEQGDLGEAKRISALRRALGL